MRQIKSFLFLEISGTNLQDSSHLTPPPHRHNHSYHSYRLQHIDVDNTETLTNGRKGENQID